MEIILLSLQIILRTRRSERDDLSEGERELRRSGGVWRLRRFPEKGENSGAKQQITRNGVTPNWFEATKTRNQQPNTKNRAQNRQNRTSTFEVSPAIFLTISLSILSLLALFSDEQPRRSTSLSHKTKSKRKTPLFLAKITPSFRFWVTIYRQISLAEVKLQVECQPCEGWRIGFAARWRGKQRSTWFLLE